MRNIFNAFSENASTTTTLIGSTLVVFDRRFEIMPGTAAAPQKEDLNEYEFGPYYNVAE
jgi:hypothetical protein